MKLLIFIVLSFTLKTVIGHPYLDEIKAFASHLRAELASQDNHLGEEPGILASQTDEELRMRLDKLLPNNISVMANQMVDQGKLQY